MRAPFDLLSDGRLVAAASTAEQALTLRDSRRMYDRRWEGSEAEIPEYVVEDDDGCRVEWCDEGCGRAGILSHADNEFRCERHTTVVA